MLGVAGEVEELSEAAVSDCFYDIMFYHLLFFTCTFSNLIFTPLDKSFCAHVDIPHRCFDLLYVAVYRDFEYHRAT